MRVTLDAKFEIEYEPTTEQIKLIVIRVKQISGESFTNCGSFGHARCSFPEHLTVPTSKIYQTIKEVLIKASRAEISILEARRFLGMKSSDFKKMYYEWADARGLLK